MLVFTDLISEKTLDKISEYVKKNIQDRKLIRCINDHRDRYKKRVFDSLPNGEDYNWQVLQTYINNNLFREITTCFLLQSKEERDRLRNHVYASAYESANAQTDGQKHHVKNYLQGIMEIVGNTLLGRVDNFLPYNVVIDEVYKVVDDWGISIKSEIQLQSKEIVERMEELHGVLLQEINHVDTHKKFLTNLPYNPQGYILHRDPQIDDLLSNVRHNKHVRLLINGFGGIGKSSIMQSLFHELKDEYQHLAWIKYDTSFKESILNSFTIYSSIVDKQERFVRIISFLNESTEDTLLFIDDYKEKPVKDLDMLNGIGAKIIITSRAPNVRGYKPIVITPLSEDECIDVFYRNYEYDDEQKHRETIRQLVFLVKRHTLSVELLALAANRIDYDIKEYLKMLKEKGFQYPDLKVSTPHTTIETVVSEHLKMLFNMMTMTEEQSKILKNFAIMPDIDIPADVTNWLGCNINDLQNLIKLGWINASGKGYSMHRIVKDAILLQYEVEYDDCREIMLYMAGNSYIIETDIYTDICIRLDISTAFLEKFSCIENEDFGRLCNNIAFAYSHQSDYHKALKWHQKALGIFEGVLGNDHPDTAPIYNNIALVHFSQGDYPKALKWIQKALEINEKVLGNEHPEIAMYYNNIAAVCTCQGDYPMALEWNQKALTIREKVLGIDHPDTATSYNNIAEGYENQGDYRKALEWHQKALTIREEGLGQSHPDTAITYGNIASVCSSQGDYQKALGWYQKALEIFERVLGDNHPYTATTYNNIALVYSHQGNYSKELEWYQKALTIFKKVLGDDHPHTATTYNNIAGAYYSQGDYQKALEWYQKALTTYEKVFGNDHPKTKGVRKKIENVLH